MSLLSYDVECMEFTVLASWGVFAVSHFKSPATNSAALHWASPCSQWLWSGCIALFQRWKCAPSHSHTSFTHTLFILSFFFSTLSSIDRRSLTVIRIFAFLLNSFEFPCIITLIILSKHKLEAGGQAEVFGKIAKGKSSVSGNICFVNIFYLPTALTWKKVSKCWQTGNESNTKSASEVGLFPM